MVTHSVFYKNKKKKLQYNRYSENNRIGANDESLLGEKSDQTLPRLRGLWFRGGQAPRQVRLRCLYDVR